ncbi:MAG: S1C family serine protease [Phycisphaerae bacterium]
MRYDSDAGRICVQWRLAGRGGWPGRGGVSERSGVARWGAVVLLLLAVAIGAMLPSLLQETLVARPESAPREVTPRGALLPVEEHIIATFQRVGPGVVFINTRARAFDRFGRGVREIPRGTGSGFFWDNDGYIVTNYHVIEGASGAQVVTADQRTFDAQLVGISPDHDLAVLKIDAPADVLKPIPMGTSSDLKVGQMVLAVGNPFGLDQTLTTGIISALDRTIREGTRLPIDNVIQTDAAINPGNSGGPLIDSAGRLIGVNTAIYSPSGGSAGVGFAIPVDTVNRVVPELILTGRYTRPQLGVQIIGGLNQAVALQLGIQGVAVAGVEPGSPAAGAGLRPADLQVPTNDLRRLVGDVIVAIGSRPVRNAQELLLAVDAYRPGDTLTLRVWNDGTERDVQLVLTQD